MSEIERYCLMTNHSIKPMMPPRFGLFCLVLVLIPNVVIQVCHKQNRGNCEVMVKQGFSGNLFGVSKVFLKSDSQLSSFLTRCCLLNTKHTEKETTPLFAKDTTMYMNMINTYNMDCMEFLKSVPDKHYDLAIVDPPYGIDIAKWDTKDHIPTDKYFEELFRVSKNQIIWGGNYFNLPHSENWFCWDKTYKYNQKLQIAEFELAWTSLLTKSKFIRYTYCGNFYGWESPQADYNKPKNIHPTQKPIDLYKWLLKNYANDGDKIFDTHGGSGSIILACHDMGFDLDWVELDPDYYKAAIKRFNDHKLQLKLI